MLTKIFRKNEQVWKIFEIFHFAHSKNLPRDTNVWLVLEFLDELWKNFKAHWISEREFDMDEYMVEYFGQYRIFLKYSIRMKLVYKIWCTNLPLGYLFGFII